MTGCILCGGKSSRMGTDKGLLKLNTVSWAQAAVQKMAGLRVQVVLSVNKDQYNNYTTDFTKDQLIRDDETIDARGPLRGLLSAHLRFAIEDLFVLACDMPLMETSILQQLFSHYKKQDAEAYVYTNDNVYEPLCGIYTAKGLSKILQLQKTNQLLNYSMKHVLEKSDTCTIPLASNQKKYFANFNSPEELNGL
jgi:molybdopterin-guanine dinucleotide biosynthesis protein A